MTIFMLQSITSTTSTQRVKYSIIVMMYYTPILRAWGFIDPTKSMEHLSKVSSVTMGESGNSLPQEVFPTPWQRLHD